MLAALERDFYREKAAEMRVQATRAETDSLRLMYESIADDWLVQAESLEGDTLEPEAVAPQISN